VETSTPLWYIVMNFLPYVLLFGFFVLIIRHAHKNPAVKEAADINLRAVVAQEAIVGELHELRKVLEEIRDRGRA
jgi:hypothetical protein